MEDDFLGLWKNSEPAEEMSFKNPPPGNFTIRIDKASLQEKEGVTKVWMQFNIEEGEHKGQKHFYSNYFNPKGLPYIKRDLCTLGFGDRLESIGSPDAFADSG